jgi:hypothetical protein
MQNPQRHASRARWPLRPEKHSSFPAWNLTAGLPVVVKQENSMDDWEKRVRDRAYKLWQEEGCPEGREGVHWEKARELIAIEDNIDVTLKPIPRPDDVGPYGEPVEPLGPAENTGETPTMVDQGEEETIPHRRTDQSDDQK